METMLRKLRRNSKDTAEDSSMRSASNSSTALSAQQTQDGTVNPARLNFFHLPAEIRNAIYELLICDTTLTLPSSICAPSKKARLPLKRRKSLPTPINGVLLASRQCRREYLAVLLSTVSVIVEVKDFDFECLMRVSERLGDLEFKSLQSNRHLTVYLMNQNCSGNNLTALRKWLSYRGEAEAPLPWKYEFPLERLRPPTTMGRVRMLRELEYYADTIAALEPDLEEPQRSELKAIIAAFECKVDELDEDLGWLGERTKSVARNLRGLAGGGLH